MFQNESDFNLSAGASRSTIGNAAMALGWAMLLATAIVTGVHAIKLVQFQTGLSAAQGDIFNIIRVAGIVLVEVFAVVTAVLLATNRLRAAQKPAALVLELTWVLFAAVNLISSFAVEHGGTLPSFVEGWVTYGLPVSSLMVAVMFYTIMRLSPDAKRADDEAELREHFARTKHQATLEVLSSPQMAAVIRQMAWQRLPQVVGRELKLSDRQVSALISQAPELLDLNGNGQPDISEQPAKRVTLSEMQHRIDEARAAEEVAEPVVYGNGHGPNPTQRPQGR